MKATLRSIYAALRDRLPTASISPREAAELLCAEHPCADSGVAAHLVDRVEGNGVLLPLPCVLALVRCGYSRVPRSGCRGVALSQWGPMEETLFCALCIGLRRRDAAVMRAVLQDALPSRGNDINHTYDRMQVVPSDGFCDGLQRRLQLLSDVASFVHHSTLSAKASRLQLLAAALRPEVQGAEEEWHCVTVPSTFDSAAVEQRRELGRLAGECLCLYGSCLSAFHRFFCDVVLAGALTTCTAFQQQQQDQQRGKERLRARVVRDVMAGVRPLLLGLLTRRACEWKHWTEPSERWMEILLQLAECLAVDAKRLKCVYGYDGDNDDAAKEQMQLLASYVDVLHILAVCFAFYHRSVFAESISVTNGEEERTAAAAVVVVRRGLDVLRHLLRAVVTTAATSKKTPSSIMPGASSSVGNTNCFCFMTVKEWCKCCDAAQLLCTLSVMHEDGASFANLRNDTEVRSMLFLGASCFLRSYSADGSSVLPLRFYTTLIKALQAWREAPHMLWDAARVGLSRCLDAAPPATRPLLELLETLVCASYTGSLSLSATRRGANAKDLVAEASVARAVREMRSNCLAHIFHKLTGVPDEIDPDLVCGLLHIAAAANRLPQCAAAACGCDLFADHPQLLNRLGRLLLPVRSGMQRFFPHVSGECEAADGETDVRLGVSAGAFLHVCEACQQALVWSSGGTAVGARGGCCCVLGCRDAGDTVAAYVELFTPVFMQRDAVRDGDAVEEPFTALWTIYQHAVAASTSQSGKGASPVSQSAVSFLIDCHQQLLLLQPSALIPSHVGRILRVVFTSSPVLFAYVPELPQLLLRRIIFPTVTNSKEHVYDGSDYVVEHAEPRELWEMLLWACAAEMARLGRRSPLLTCCRDEDRISISFTAAATQHSDAEDAEAVLNVLGDVEVDCDSALFTLRQRVLRRALELVH
ncbi:hypothetical protein DQ04_08221010 [Trypanosoma grayi]|uniref:hypothetical protein n=1 Tax=Trypanosoma grayi TaxID=71804 RepID=UPI0004F3FC32|nr:hypothetical protein DQ04_08221010 [Trypanosoma grayi]KEG08010.1 hypothetical protein DQ04_08221010 [Trypanosoma grayi]